MPTTRLPLIRQLPLKLKLTKGFNSLILFFYKEDIK